MDTPVLIQVASNIAGPIAGAQYQRYSGIEASRITEIAAIAVKIARAIELEAHKPG